MTKDIPMIARMIVINDIIIKEKNEKLIDKSYYNSNFDSDNEYCINTTAWD